MAALVASALGLSCPPASPSRHSPLTADWQRALPHTETPKGVPGLRASDCGSCHADVVAEWTTSAHANAWVDPQFQTEWKKDKQLWMCVNCHAPLENQQPSIVFALEGGDLLKPVRRDNPRFDGQLREEGIGCAACHVREGSVIAAKAPLKEAPHAVRVDRAALSVDSCLRCHNAKANVTDALVCTFDTGDDWRTTKLPAAGVTCIDCHLPPTQRSHGPGRRHDFLGAGIAKTGASHGRSALSVALELSPDGYEPGQTAHVRAVVMNALAGHSVPTGDVERWSEVRFELLDGQSSTWSRVERFGEKWEWYPKARKLSDNSLRRGEQRAFELEVPIPKDAREPKLRVVIENHRMTPQTHSWSKLPDSYPLAAEAFSSVTPMTLKR